MERNLDKKIESILFFKGHEVSFKELEKLLNCTESEIKDALDILKEKLEDRGISLVLHNEKATLTTSPDSSELIQNITKEELSKELSKSALETLSIILYRGPVRRNEVDYIRGVSSQFSIRNLLVRGLIEKSTTSDDARSFIYQPSTEFLQYLGITSLDQLDNYQKIRAELQSYIDSNNKDAQENEV